VRASAAGKRSKQRTEASGKIGIEGEDIIEACPEEGRLRLQLPSRFALGTVKEAAWRVSGAGLGGVGAGRVVMKAS
jgi:hypothetical protein